MSIENCLCDHGLWLDERCKECEKEARKQKKEKAIKKRLTCPDMDVINALSAKYDIPGLNGRLAMHDLMHWIKTGGR